MRKHMLIVAFSGLALCITGVLSICEPKCDGKGPGDKVGDPKNCTQFYVCLADGVVSDHSVPCTPPNGIFDDTAGHCVSGDASDCEASCVPPACHLTCNRTGSVDVISDPSKCGTYYACLGGVVVGDPMTCPPNLPYFNGNICVDDKSQCCSDLCVPYCYPGSVQIPDPYDCRSYYICLQDGPVNENLKFPCDEGEVFDVTTARCKKEAQCRVLCDGAAGNDNPGTPPVLPTITTPPITATVTIPTTPVTNPPTTTPVITTTTDCMETFQCSSAGSFAKCLTCNAKYFQCTGAGVSAEEKECFPGFVFNPVPSYPYCILKDECPYTPIPPSL